MFPTNYVSWWACMRCELVAKKLSWVRSGEYSNKCYEFVARKDKTDFYRWAGHHSQFTEKFSTNSQPTHRIFRLGNFHNLHNFLQFSFYLFYNPVYGSYVLGCCIFIIFCAFYGFLDFFIFLLLLSVKFCKFCRQKKKNILLAIKMYEVENLQGIANWTGHDG